MGITVVICMLAYNHEKFISKAIESVINQETTFNYKLIIANDSSTDQTAQIVQKYAQDYPDIVKIINNEINQGLTENSKMLYELALELNPKYIATLEGDDYWIDNHKLEKQVTFMDDKSNTNVVLTCGGFNEFDEENSKFIAISEKFNYVKDNWCELKLDTILLNWQTKYLTYMIRASVLKEIDLNKFQYLVDYHLIYELRNFGKIYFYSGIFGVYRRHLGGYFGKINDKQRYKKEILIYRSLLKHYNHDTWLWSKYRKTSQKLGYFEMIKFKIENKLKVIAFGI